MLSGGAVLLALGLAAIGFAPSLTVFLQGWAVIGMGMGASLYDPAFSTLGRLYGTAARHPITMLTLSGGFASTVCWPISAWLVDVVGLAWNLPRLCRRAARGLPAAHLVHSAE